jgi:hypothetical protein
VAIQRGGIFSINRDAYELLGRPAAVEFVFDPQERVMGFRPATVDAPHAYAARKQRDSDSHLVSGRAFCRYANIPLDHSARYRAELMGDVLAIDLNAPVSTTKPPAKKPIRAGEASPLGAH